MRKPKRSYKSKAHKPIKYIYVPIYDTNIWYFYDWNREDVHKFLKENYGFDNFNPNNAAGSVCEIELFRKVDNKKSMVYALWIEDPMNYGVVVHEVFHIIWKVLYRCGLTLTVESEESFTYLITWVFNEVISHNN